MLSKRITFTIILALAVNIFMPGLRSYGQTPMPTTPMPTTPMPTTPPPTTPIESFVSTCTVSSPKPAPGNCDFGGGVTGVGIIYIRDCANVGSRCDSADPSKKCKQKKGQVTCIGYPIANSLTPPPEGVSVADYNDGCTCE